MKLINLINNYINHEKLSQLGDPLPIVASTLLQFNQEILQRRAASVVLEIESTLAYRAFI